MCAPIGTWRKVPPHRCNDETEERVDKGEDPRRSLVVQDALQPMLNEAYGIGCCASLGAQPHFERGERADGAEPGLCHNNCDCREVCNPKPQGIDPPPRAKVSNDDEDQAADDERDDDNMQREHHIGE